MEEKLARVTLWLEKIFGNLPIPKYEVNAETVDFLYELAKFNEDRKEDLTLLIEDMKQQATEYDAEANYLQGLLQSLGIFLCSMSHEGFSNLEVLVNSAMALETKDTSLTSFFHAISDTTSELYETELKNREMELELRKIKEKLPAVLMLEEQLKEDIKETEKQMEVYKAKINSELQDLKFLKDKSLDFKIRIESAEVQLTATELDQSLTHESLMNLSKKIEKLLEDIVPLQKQLEFYLDLPASPSLAHVKIEELKRELKALDEELSKEVDKLTHEML